MKRQFLTEGLILRAERSGEMNKAVSLFSPELGFFQATAYGAYKPTSRLSGVSEPFRHVRLHLYHDPVRKSYKITDLELIASFDAVRGELSRFYRVCLWIELLQKSASGTEGSQEVFSLLKEGLLAMNDPQRDVSYVSATFLIRYVRFLGLFPGIEDCPSCGKPFESGADVFFCPEDSEFHCRSCGLEGFFRLTAGGISYLRHTEDIPFDAACRVGLDKTSLSSLEAVVYAMIRSLLGEELKTLASIKEY
jgi:DNA repair protein RecO (recombination protein O)